MAAKKSASSEQLVSKSPLKDAVSKAKSSGKKHAKKDKHRKTKHALNKPTNTKDVSKKVIAQEPKKVAAAVSALPAKAPVRKIKNPSSHYETRTEWLYDSTAATDKDCGQALMQAQTDLKSLYEEQCGSLKEARGCVGCTPIEFGRMTKDTTSDNQCEVRLSAQWQAEDCISIDN